MRLLPLSSIAPRQTTCAAPRIGHRRRSRQLSVLRHDFRDTFAEDLQLASDRIAHLARRRTEDCGA